MDLTIYRIRGGSLRLTVGMMVSAFYFIIFFSEFICSSKLKMALKNWIIACAILIAIVLIVQTRMNLLAIGLSVACMMAFCMKNPSKKILFFSGILIMAVLALQLPTVQNYISEYFGGIFDFTDNAMIPRAGAIPHYIKMAKNNKLFGIGIINADAPSNGQYDLMYIMHGKWGVYSYDDVGVFSYYMMYGIVGIAMYIFLFARLFKRAWKERYVMPYKLGIVMYVAITGVSMIITDLWRQSNIALFLLLMDLQPKISDEVNC